MRMLKNTLSKLTGGSHHLKFSYIPSHDDIDKLFASWFSSSMFSIFHILLVIFTGNSTPLVLSNHNLKYVEPLTLHQYGNPYIMYSSVTSKAETHLAMKNCSLHIQQIPNNCSAFLRKWQQNSNIAKIIVINIKQKKDRQTICRLNV